MLTLCVPTSVLCTTPYRPQHLHLMEAAIAAQMETFNVLLYGDGEVTDADSKTDFADNRTALESSIRLRLLQLYVQRVKAAVQEGDIPATALDSGIKCASLVDAVLRGSPSERFAQHIRLYGSELTPWQTQSCFYSLLEPEVDTVIGYWLGEMERAVTHPKGAKLTPAQKNDAALFKEHNKKLAVFAKTYLLDRTELNVHARCCFAWTGATPLCLSVLFSCILY